MRSVQVKKLPSCATMWGPCCGLLEQLVQIARRLLVRYLHISRMQHLGALRDLNKLITKLKMQEIRILFPRFSSMPFFLIWADTSLGNLPNKVDTGGGFIVLLTDKEGHSAPLAWVANKIKRKVSSTLAAECLILLQAIDHAIYLRGLLGEIVNRETSVFKMVAMTDSKNLVSNLQSVHQPKEYCLRFEIAQLQQYLSEGLIIEHVAGCSQLADPLSKRTASSHLLLKCLKTGMLPEQCRVKGTFI